MDRSAFWSAVIGGFLVIAGHVVVHALNRGATKIDKEEKIKDRIAAQALEVLNWLQIDQQAVFAARGGPVTPIQQGHPVYALAALLRRSQPEMGDISGNLLREFREYYQVTRILIPNAQADDREQYVDRVGSAANKLVEHLGVIVEGVCPSAPAQT